ADRVADLRTRAADAGGELLLRDAEVLEALLIRGCFFEGVQFGPVEVLEERVAQEVLVGRVADDRGDRLEAGLAGSSGAALPHDELVRPVALVAHDDRLQHTELAHTVDEFSEVVGVEVGAWLARVRNDRVRVDVHQPGARNLDQLLELGRRRDVVLGDRPREEHVARTHLGRLGRRDEGADPATQTSALRHQAPPSLKTCSFSATAGSASSILSSPTASPSAASASLPASRPLSPRATISTAASRYATAPADCPSYAMTVWPKLGASET